MKKGYGPVVDSASNGSTRQRTPLTGKPAWHGTQTAISERAFLGKLTLRGRLDDSKFTAAVETVVGGKLPTIPNTSTFAGTSILTWVGPDEWLVFTADGAEQKMLTALREALIGVHSAVADVSDYYTVIRVAGAKARDVMAKGCPIDLHPTVFQTGNCAGSLYNKAAIRLLQMDDTPTYDIMVRWSFAEYLWKHLVKAAEEWA